MSHFTKIFTYLVTLSCYVCTKRPIMIRLNFKDNYLTTDKLFSLKLKKKHQLYKSFFVIIVLLF